MAGLLGAAPPKRAGPGFDDFASRVGYFLASAFQEAGEEALGYPELNGKRGLRQGCRVLEFLQEGLPFNAHRK